MSGPNGGGEHRGDPGGARLAPEVPLRGSFGVWGYFLMNLFDPDSILPIVLDGSRLGSRRPSAAAEERLRCLFLFVVVSFRPSNTVV